MYNFTGAYYVEVDSTDGYYVSVKFFTGENSFKPIDNIPILQSPYLSPNVQQGDFGVILNIRNNIASILEGLENNNEFGSVGQNYFVFVPLLKKEQFQSAAELLEIKSPDLKSVNSLLFLG